MALCAYMIVGTVLVYRKNGYQLICNEFDAQDQDMAFMLWVFYLSKILDFCDTLFIVVRSAWSRFTFLHIYHHAVRRAGATAWTLSNGDGGGRGGGGRVWRCL